MKVFVVGEQYEAPSAFFSSLEKAQAWVEAKKESYQVAMGHSRISYYIDEVVLDVDVQGWWEGEEEE